MSDFLLQIGKNPQARKVIQGLGLPIPLPYDLQRSTGALEDAPLTGRSVVVGGGGAVEGALKKALEAAGAHVRPIGPEAAPDKAWAFAFDATGIADPAGLRAVYDFFHPLAGKLAASGKVIVIGRPPEDSDTPAAAAAQAALEGFTRSLAKELGRKGGTANLLRVETGAERWLAGPVRFLLTARSAFVTAQPLRVTAAGPKASQESSWLRSLQGKSAIVTGAGRGIGEATARLLAQEGASVMCIDRPEDEALAAEVARSIGGFALGVDISRPDAPAKIAEQVRARFGGLDIIVHNAGITRDKTLGKMKGEIWDQAIDVNLASVLRINDALLAAKLLRDGGRIVCLSSIAGIGGNFGQTNYAASKSGIVGYVRDLAPRLAAQGITVNAIAPGFIETRLTAAIPVMIREAGRRMCALGQGGRPTDVGCAITFLASPGAQGVTGQTLRVCGGALLGA